MSLFPDTIQVAAYMFKHLKKKCKIILEHDLKTYGGMVAWLHSFLVLDRGKWSPSHSGRLMADKEPPVPIE
jgi:hypothetical protein